VRWKTLNRIANAALVVAALGLLAVQQRSLRIARQNEAQADQVAAQYARSNAQKALEIAALRQIINRRAEGGVP
jgi:Zn-dependent protease with chaperone function